VAVSHICTSCGLDLARLRAAVEPHYGLPLVVCPECSTPAIRRREPITARWREGSRIARAFGALLARIVAGIVLMGGSVGVIFMLEEEARQRGRNIVEFPGLLLKGDAGWIARGDWAWVVIFFIAWASLQAGAGVLLIVGLAHWRPGALPWAVWAATLVLCLSLVPATYPVRAAMGWMIADPVAYDGPALGVWLGRVAVGLAAMAGMPLGVILGWGVRAMDGPVRRLRFRAQRRRRGRERGFGE
jgi:hypothetical protein